MYFPLYFNYKPHGKKILQISYRLYLIVVRVLCYVFMCDVSFHGESDNVRVQFHVVK